MVKIEIGINPYTNEPVYYFDHGGFGVIPVIANARYGKTMLVKMLYTLIANGTGRQVVVFDYAGDHKKSVYPNTNFGWGEVPRHMQGLENALLLGGKTFKVSDFGGRHHWSGIGFADAGARDIAYHFARRVRDTDLDHPVEFGKLLEDIPLTYEQVPAFNEKYRRYKIFLPAPMNEGEYRSLINRYASVMEWFSPNDKTHVSDYGDLLVDKVTEAKGYHTRSNNRSMIIELGMHVDERKMSLQTAKILEDIEYYLERNQISPMFVLEEADRIIPNPLMTKQIFPSLWVVERICRRHQRHNPKVMLLGQDPSILYEPALEMWHTAFLGICPDSAKNIFGQKAYELTKRLKWDIAGNYREFVMVEKGGDSQIFVPHQCPCA